MFQQLDVFRVHLHGDDQQIRQFDEEALHARTLQLLQRSLLTVKRTADDPDPLAHHLGGHLLRFVETGAQRGFDRMDKTLHLRIVDRHRSPITVSQKAILQRADPVDNRIERPTRVVYEEQILHEGDPDRNSLALMHDQFVHHGGKYLDPQVLEQFVGRISGIVTRQVAHDEPLPHISRSDDRQNFSYFHSSEPGHAICILCSIEDNPSTPASCSKRQYNKQLHAPLSELRLTYPYIFTLSCFTKKAG